MPIRMVDDPKSNNNNSGGRKGGFNPALLLFLPTILKFLFKRPKLLLVVLIIGGIFFYFNGLNLGGDDLANDPSPLSTGLEMSPEMYARSEIYEPLAAGYKSGLPSSYSLEEYCPPRKNQGAQGSCVGWSSSYAARSIMQSRATGKNPSEVAFSPSSLYNQISLPGCQGAYIHNAMDVMQERGVLPWNEFAYNERDCSKKPNSQQLQYAAQFKTKGFQRLWENQGGTDINAIKQNIAQGAPVVIGMMVGGTFMTDMMNNKLWTPTKRDYKMAGFGGHAMCVMGYDDNMQGGAFQIMNSWGEDWGDRGFGWIRYRDFEFFTKEAYGLYPMGDASIQDPTKLSVSFGLMNNATNKNIPVNQVQGNLFRTVAPIAIGTTFKIEVTNSIECYTYVFGEETDGSSYVLFPYTEKHSPYCGIVGTRLFPRDQSLKADDLGKLDRMAIVVSKVELDYTKLNKAINEAPGSYQQKINKVLQPLTVNSPTFSAGQVISLEANVQDQNRPLAGMVIEIDKR